MTPSPESARGDLAFLRALVENPGRRDSAAGRFFLATGLIWAFDTVVFWLHYAGAFTLTQTQQIVFVGAVTLVWLFFAIRLRWGAPPKGDPAVGAAGRAYAAAGAGIGAVAFGTLVVFLTAAVRSDAGVAFFAIYPSMMFLCFGAMWLAGYSIVRRPLRLFVALGWFAAAVAMATAPTVLGFIAIAGLSMLLLMALPGAIMIRAERKQD